MRMHEEADPGHGGFNYVLMQISTGIQQVCSPAATVNLVQAAELINLIPKPMYELR